MFIYDTDLMDGIVNLYMCHSIYIMMSVQAIPEIRMCDILIFGANVLPRLHMCKIYIFQHFLIKRIRDWEMILYPFHLRSHENHITFMLQWGLPTFCQFCKLLYWISKSIYNMYIVPFTFSYVDVQVELDVCKHEQRTCSQ